MKKFTKEIVFSGTSRHLIPWYELRREKDFNSSPWIRRIWFKYTVLIYFVKSSCSLLSYSV